jgi:ParB family transcriptional regulator, chromosome partitioning protein
VVPTQISTTTSPSYASLRINRDDESDEWFTSPEILDAARDVLGDIDLDPASCIEAQQTVRASRYFTKADDGLRHAWRGRVWLNPPYSRPAMDQFAAKIVQEVRAGHVGEAILLVNIVAEQKWFHEVLSVCSAVCFYRGRMRFVHKSGKSQCHIVASALFYFGPRVERFASRFSEFGCVLFTQHADEAEEMEAAE